MRVGSENELPMIDWECNNRRNFSLESIIGKTRMIRGAAANRY